MCVCLTNREQEKQLKAQKSIVVKNTPSTLSMSDAKVSFKVLYTTALSEVAPAERHLTGLSCA